MARPERFELPTAWFVARYSIQLSYGRVIDSTSTSIPGASFSPAILAGHRVANARWTFSPGSIGPLYANVRNGLALYRKIGGEGEVLASAVTHTERRCFPSADARIRRLSNPPIDYRGLDSTGYNP